MKRAATRQWFPRISGSNVDALEIGRKHHIPVFFELYVTEGRMLLIEIKPKTFKNIIYGMDSEAEIYGDYSIDPLTQTLDALRADFAKQAFLKVSVSGRIWAP